MEPTQLDNSVPWVYNELTYKSADTHFQLSLTLAPAFKDVKVIVKIDQDAVYQLDATGVRDVRYHNEMGHEALEVVVSKWNSIWIRIKPNISIHQQSTEDVRQ